MFEATDEERETEKRVTNIDTSIQSHETLEPWKDTVENFSFNWRSYTFTHSVALTQHAGFPCFQCTNSKKPRASFFQLLRCKTWTTLQARTASTNWYLAGSWRCGAFFYMQSASRSSSLTKNGSQYLWQLVNINYKESFHCTYQKHFGANLEIFDTHPFFYTKQKRSQWENCT